LTTWCFGFPAPKHLRWTTKGRDVPFWYTKRLEHIHTTPFPWELEDEFQRALAWQSEGLDDVLEVSVPWGQDEEVTFKDRTIPTGRPGGDDRFPVLVREYRTPSGSLRHAVRKTAAEAPGWPVQPGFVPLFEDLNIPRAVQHAVSSPASVPLISHLYTAPDRKQRRWFASRMAKMKEFADREGFFVQAWTAFGMDAAVWLTGTQNAIMMALDAPQAFRQLLDIIAEADYARTELAARSDAVDMVCMRGWYSSTDFWSPALFDEFVFPYVKALADLARRHGRKFAYVMTTGVEKLGPRLADAGTDLLYFVDPVQDRISLEAARDLLSDRMTLVGGTNALSLASGDPNRIRNEVRRAMDTLGPTRRFILHPIDAIFPDTPWHGVETMVEAWKDYQ
jgi:hypothetical protein